MIQTTFVPIADVLEVAVPADATAFRFEVSSLSTVAVITAGDGPRVVRRFHLRSALEPRAGVYRGAFQVARAGTVRMFYVYEESA
jgi:hypothetical protein